MHIKEFLGWIGKLEMIKKNKKGDVISKKTVYNRLMDDGLDEIIKALYAPFPDIELKYVAIGDDDTANSDDLTKLYNEYFRVPIVNKYRNDVGECKSVGVLLDYQPESLSGICTIKEIGFFAGTLAEDWNEGLGKDTGLMVSRIVLGSPESKTATEQIDFVRTDTFERG